MRGACRVMALVAFSVVVTSHAANPESPAIDSAELAQASDQQLTAIAARWSDLSAAERRAVLIETTQRMDAKKSAGSPQVRGGRLSIRVQRYGRERDGSVVMETRVVQVRPSNQTDHNATPRRGGVDGRAGERTLQPGVEGRPVGYGVGFEQRRAQRNEKRPTPP